MKMTKLTKQAISLIVLVITIIVMIILAGTVIISISNNGIIDKAQEAVDKTNLKEVEQLVSLAWMNAYLDGTTTLDDLKDAVDQALEDAKVNLNKYEITVTTNGVTVKVKDTTTTPPTNPDDGDDEPTTPTQLLKPTISLSGDTLTIIDNASNGSYTASFEIYVGEEKQATITASSTTTFDLTTLELTSGTYIVTVKAVAEEGTTITASEASDSVEYVVEEAGVPEDWQTNVAAIVDGVPIPKGFVASPYGADSTNNLKAENTKNGGLVIYELTATEIANGATTLPSNETQHTSWTTRNQYVWVPVDNFEQQFKRIDFLNGGRVYANGSYNALGETNKYWEVIVNEATNLPKTTIAEQSATYMSTTTLAEVQAMYASVKEYGGFYIARYEAGIDTQRASKEDAIVKTLSNVHSKMNKIPYNYMKWSTSTTMNVDTGAAVEVARSLYPNDTTNTTGVVSTLTYGIQWDRTIQWYIDTNAMTESEATTTTGSTAYGNYNNHDIASYTELNTGAKYAVYNTTLGSYQNVTSSYTKGSSTTNEKHLLTTGALKAANVNNIYDMSGNMYEWTMEGYSSLYRAFRGGDFHDGGDYIPVSFRNGNVPNTAGSNYGFRPSLYIKK